jgi:molybdate/tungstate transport system permease protein
MRNINISRKLGDFGSWTKRNPMIVVFSVLSLLIILFIALPIVVMVFGEDLGSIGTALGDPIVRDSILLSVSTAFVATIIALLAGVPLGYMLARKRFFGKSLVQAIVDIPVVVPHTVAGIALLTVFGSQGIIGAPLESVGIKFVDAVPGIIVAMLFVSVPFVINASKNGFQSVDPRLENVARSLGAGQFRAFSTVAVPLASRSIITGAIMCWARAVSEFGAVIILVYHPIIAPTLIYDRFTNFGLADAKPIAVLLIIVCLLIFFSLGALGNWRRKG